MLTSTEGLHTTDSLCAECDFADVLSRVQELCNSKDYSTGVLGLTG